MSRRVVHVVDPAGPVSSSSAVLSRGAAADIAVMACAEAIRACPDAEHAVVTLGTKAAAEHAAGLGLRETGVEHHTLPTPLGHAALACRPLRHLLGSLGQTDVIQPWSRRAHLACASAACGRTPVAPVPVDIFPSFTPATPTSGAEARAALKVPDGLPLIGLLSDPVIHADTRRFVYLVGILQVAGYPVAGLVDRRAGHTARARRFHAESGVNWRVLLPQEPTTTLLHACDMAMVLPPAVHQPLAPDQATWVRWSVLRAHMLGVPVVGAGEWLDGGLLPQAGEFFEAWDGALRSIIRRLLALATDPAALRQVAGEVQKAAARAATPDRLARDMATLWDNATPQPRHSVLRAALA